MLKINNSFATGPYFDFSMRGNIDVKNRTLDLNGHVNPALYGISKLIGSIPLIGRIFNGNIVASSNMLTIFVERFDNDVYFYK